MYGDDIIERVRLEEYEKLKIISHFLTIPLTIRPDD